MNAACAVAVAACFGWWLGSYDLEEAYACTVDVWGVKESYAEQGSALCFLKRVQDLSPAEPDGYDADDHVRAILEHAGPGVMDVCIANDAPVPPEIMEPYAKEGVSQLELRREDLEQMGLAVRTFPLLEPGRYIRHNSDALARAILSVWREFRN